MGKHQFHPSGGQPQAHISPLPTRGQTPETREATTMQPIESRPDKKPEKMKCQRNMSWMKEQGKTPEEQLSEVNIGNPPEKDFKVMIVRVIQDLGKHWR